MDNVIKGLFRRHDIDTLTIAITKAIYDNPETLTVAEVVGILEMVKLEIISTQ